MPGGTPTRKGANNKYAPLTYNGVPLTMADPVSGEIYEPDALSGPVNSISQLTRRRKRILELMKSKGREMPDPDSDETQAARRRSVAEQARRRGRASTILTDTLGE